MICFSNLTRHLKNTSVRFEHKEKIIKIILRFEKEHVSHLGDQKYYNGYVSEKITAGKIEMTFVTDSMKGFAHWYMMICFYAEIVQPNELKEEAKAMIRNVLKWLE